MRPIIWSFRLFLYCKNIIIFISQGSIKDPLSPLKGDKKKHKTKNKNTQKKNTQKTQTPKKQTNKIVERAEMEWKIGSCKPKSQKKTRLNWSPNWLIWETKKLQRNQPTLEKQPSLKGFWSPDPPEWKKNQINDFNTLKIQKFFYF